MKFGIKITDKDDTPGFRSTDIYEEWFSSKEERDKRFNQYTTEHDSQNPKDLFLEQQLGNSSTQTYKRIEKDEKN